MNQPRLIPEARIPRYGETKAEAYAKMLKSGRMLKQDERVRLAIAYLEPVSRGRLCEFLAEPSVPGLVPMLAPSVTRSVNSLIWAGKVRVLAKTPGRYGADVETLGLGTDERVKRRKGRLLEQPVLPGFPMPQTMARRSMEQGFAIGALLGFAVGGIVGVILYAFISGRR